MGLYNPTRVLVSARLPHKGFGSAEPYDQVFLFM